MTSGRPRRKGRGDEAGEVADDSAAQGDDQGVAIGLVRDELVIKPRRLRRAISRPHRVERRTVSAAMPASLERGLVKRRKGQIREMPVGDDQRALGTTGRSRSDRGPGERTAPNRRRPAGDDLDVVRAQLRARPSRRVLR